MTARPSVWNRDSLKAVLIFAGLLVPYHWYLLRWETLSGLSTILIYFAVFLICLLATLAAGLSTSLLFRGLCGIGFATSVLLVDSYQRVMDEPLHYASFVNLFETASFAGDALEQFGGHILPPIIAATLIAIGVILPARPRTYRYTAARLMPATAPFVAIALLAAVVFARNGSGATGMPGTIVPGAYGAVMATEKMMQFGRKREHITIARGPTKRTADIVLIIDESIRGDYLDLAGGKVLSGLLQPDGTPKPGVYNFGRAASAANCSAGTNITLRYGGTRTTFQRYIATKPTIWAYAKAAGYRTVYMDAQLTEGRLGNSMTKKDLRSIDEFIQFDKTPVRDRDQKIAKLIVEHTRNDQPEFIVANKIGAHFPVNDKYPDSYLIYKPASPRGRLANVAMADSDTTTMNWTLYKNAYRNTLLWNVGHFLDTVLTGADLDNAIILYTSDHGQNFHEDGSPGFGTHCSQRPPASEGIVTIALMTKVPDVGSEAAEWSRANFDDTSHFDIFPTLLDLMAYEPEAVRQVYGPSLFEPTNDPLTFNARFTELGITPPLWVSIGPAPLQQNALLR
jgi:glucan phosphoethanolaminetransferase (alkaline phosphatase superfamily)